MAHNEAQEAQIRLQHFIFPGSVAFMVESFLGILVLLLINIDALSTKFFSEDTDVENPVSYTQTQLDNAWNSLNQSHIFEQISIFILWAMVGALTYILVFRLVQILVSLRYSAEDASKYIEAQSGFGVIFWLISLKDFFATFLVKMVGLFFTLFASIAGFNFASNYLLKTLAGSLPQNLGDLALSLLFAIFAMRIFVSGIGLLFPRFRAWYYA